MVDLNDEQSTEEFRSQFDVLVTYKYHVQLCIAGDNGECSAAAFPDQIVITNGGVSVCHSGLQLFSRLVRHVAVMTDA